MKSIKFEISRDKNLTDIVEINFREDGCIIGDTENNINLIWIPKELYKNIAEVLLKETLK